MPELITIVAGVTTIVGNVWRISKDVSDLIEGIENAPQHILALSQDVRGLYGVLGPLQGLLQNLKGDRLPDKVVPVFESLQQPLDHCFWAFRELQIKICKYTKPTGDIKRSKWTAFRWQFTEKDTNAYRAHLASYKSTIDIALNAANLANTSQTIQATHSLEHQIQTMRIQLAGLKQNSADGPYGSIDMENRSQVTDQQFALRRFLETTETAFSGSPAIAQIKTAVHQRNQNDRDHRRSETNYSEIEQTGVEGGDFWKGVVYALSLSAGAVGILQGASVIRIFLPHPLSKAGILTCGAAVAYGATLGWGIGNIKEIS